MLEPLTLLQLTPILTPRAPVGNRHYATRPFRVPSLHWRVSNNLRPQLPILVRGQVCVGAFPLQE